MSSVSIENMILLSIGNVQKEKLILIGVVRFLPPLTNSLCSTFSKANTNYI